MLNHGMLIGAPHWHHISPCLWCLPTPSRGGPEEDSQRAQMRRTHVTRTPQLKAWWNSQVLDMSSFHIISAFTWQFDCLSLYVHVFPLLGKTQRFKTYNFPWLGYRENQDRIYVMETHHFLPKLTLNQSSHSDFDQLLLKSRFLLLLHPVLLSWKPFARAEPAIPSLRLWQRTRVQPRTRVREVGCASGSIHSASGSFQDHPIYGHNLWIIYD